MFSVIGTPLRHLGTARARSRIAVALLPLSLLFTVRTARADVAACVAAHSHGQAERNAGRLQSAKADFISCSTAECPGAIQSECAAFLAEVEGFSASVVFAAIDADGNDATDVKVTVDQQPLLDKLTGLATTLDPGSHDIVYTWPDGFEQKQTVVVAQGEKNRRFELRREAKKAAAAVSPPPVAVQPKKSPVVAYVLTGVGVAALGSFAAFAITGKSAQSRMDGCKPNCKQAQVDKMRLRYLLADISLGVGVVALGAGGYFYFSASREPNSSAWRGGSVGVRGTF
jgi:hypothetical protein